MPFSLPYRVAYLGNQEIQQPLTSLRNWSTLISIPFGSAGLGAPWGSTLPHTSAYKASYTYEGTPWTPGIFFVLTQSFWAFLGPAITTPPNLGLWSGVLLRTFKHATCSSMLMIANLQDQWLTSVGWQVVELDRSSTTLATRMLLENVIFTLSEGMVWKVLQGTWRIHVSYR